MKSNLQNRRELKIFSESIEFNPIDFVLNAMIYNRYFTAVVLESDPIDFIACSQS